MSSSLWWRWGVLYQHRYVSGQKNSHSWLTPANMNIKSSMVQMISVLPSVAYQENTENSPAPFEVKLEIGVSARASE